MKPLTHPSSHPSLCRGHNKELSLFRSVAYLPLVQKLFDVVKVVFVVLKMTLPELGVTGTLLWSCHTKFRKTQKSLAYGLS